MDDFSAKPGVPNAYGLIGGSANKIAPQKRMLSSMTPTLVLKDEEIFLVTGSPGGSRIISTVLQILINVIDHQLNIADATYLPRLHHQWFPDKVFVESLFNIDTAFSLNQLGHQTKTTWPIGRAHSVLQKDGIKYGVTDSRLPGTKALGY